jgi:hypothetical protein
VSSLVDVLSSRAGRISAHQNLKLLSDGRCCDCEFIWILAIYCGLLLSFCLKVQSGLKDFIVKHKYVVVPEASIEASALPPGLQQIAKRRSLLFKSLVALLIDITVPELDVIGGFQRDNLGGCL